MSKPKSTSQLRDLAARYTKKVLDEDAQSTNAITAEDKGLRKGRALGASKVVTHCIRAEAWINAFGESERTTLIELFQEIDRDVRKSENGGAGNQNSLEQGEAEMLREFQAEARNLLGS